MSFRHTTRRPSDRNDDMYAVGGYSTGRVVVEFHQEHRSSKMLEKVLMVSGGCDSTRSPAPPSPAGDSHRSIHGLDNPLAVYSKACATSLTCCLQKEASSAVTALHHRCWSARWRPRIVGERSPPKNLIKVQTATQCFLDSQSSPTRLLSSLLPRLCGSRKSSARRNKAISCTRFELTPLFSAASTSLVSTPACARYGCYRKLQC